MAQGQLKKTAKSVLATKMGQKRGSVAARGTERLTVGKTMRVTQAISNTDPGITTV
jgi:hypothetical protein